MDRTLKWIELSSESVSNGNIGFLARKPKTIPLDTIIELGCGWYSDSEGKETGITLNIIQSVGILGGKKRHLLGYWLATELKVQVFETIEEFVKRNQIPLKMIRYGPLFEKRSAGPTIIPASKTPPIDKGSPIEITESNEILRLQWDTRRVCTETVAFWFLIVFLCEWTPVSILIIYVVVQPNADIASRVIAILWFVMGIGAVCLISYILAQRFWTEWIEVSKDSVSQGRIGWFAGKPKTFALDSIYELGYSPKDPTVSLTISYGRPDRRKRRTFGYWVNPEFKEKIFGTIEDFVARNQIPLRMVRYGP